MQQEPEEIQEQEKSEGPPYKSIIPQRKAMQAFLKLDRKTLREIQSHLCHEEVS